MTNDHGYWLDGSMDERTVMASRFKEQCLALLDLVAETKQSVLITKHGRAVARLVPLEDEKRKPLRGSVTFLTSDEEELYSTGERWEADRRGR